MNTAALTLPPPTIETALAKVSAKQAELQAAKFARWLEVEAGRL